MVKDIEAAEILLTAFTYWWITRITYSWNIGGPLSSQALRAGAPLRLWQVAFLVLAITATAALITGNLRLRSYTWLASTVMWLISSSVIVYTIGLTTDATLTAILFLGSLWMYFRTIIDRSTPPLLDDDLPRYIDLT
jgi:hypothetical protein